MKWSDPHSDPVIAAVPKRRQAPKGEMRREALLDAAIVIIARTGYTSASMKDVARLAGITTTGLLHYFPNKIALLTAVLDRREAVATAEFERLNLRGSMVEFLQGLRTIFYHSIEFVEISQAFMMLNVESLAQNHPAWLRFQQRFYRVHGVMASYLEGLVDAGEISSKIDLKLLAQEIFAMMDGAQIQWLRCPDKVDAMQLFDSFIDRLALTLPTES
ncbi:TetR/AcrR family transcriptional regulator [Pseudomonas sp. MWU16-30317]|uniref:TetR/AcrR family transcriptional regulator n=1 Tax=Pseudomonas sp. MWU16-30317 TaxID=2878095 RepID=UPI001CFA26B0|nr:TetR/AcrR family transcriptional regulator [Pseudomonas sp. MWU16-30317]